MATIQVPDGAKTINLPNGQVVEIPSGTKTVDIPDNLLEQTAIPEGEEVVEQPADFVAPAAPFTEVNGELVQTEIPQQQDPTIGEQIVGAGEAALALGTGATAGALGQIGGTLKGLAEQILSGEFGTQQAAQAIKKEAEKVGGALTYQPRTEAGQDILESTAEALEPLTALTPATAEIAAVTQGIKSVIPKTAPKAATKIETPTPQPETTIEGIAEISKKASQGNKKAQQQLAQEVKVNPQAIDAAERLGIDLPVDILGDSNLVKQTAGLVRSQIGDESAKWANTIENAVIKADEAMDSLGRSNIADTSAKVVDNIVKNVNSLEKQSTKLYNSVKMPKNSEVQPVNSLDRITQVVDDIGGVQQLTKEEKKLFNLLRQNKITYGALERERRQIGQALGALPTGKYVNADRSLLSSVYGALKRDQLDNVEATLGKDARDKIHLADRTFQKKVALEKRIADNFGKDGEGSMSGLLQRAMTQGSKGDITALNKVLKVVPKSLQKETIISAFADAVGSKRGVDFGEFDFNNFTKLYSGLKKNRPVLNKIMSTIGGDKKQILDDLDNISNRLTQAKSNVITTGKANQAILNKIQEEALMQRVIKFTVERGVQGATLGGISPSLSGLFKTPKDKLSALGSLIRSNEFFELAKESIGDNPNSSTVNKLINSNQFKRWNKATGNQIKNPETWIYESLTLPKEETEENGN